MKVKNKILGIVIILTVFVTLCFSQNDQASLILDLKKARASYEIALQKFENDKKLIEKKAISEEEFAQSKNQLLSAEVDYQKLILNVLAQQSYVLVEKAVKYQTKKGEKRVKLVLRNTMEGNQEYLKQFEEHFDEFTSQMKSNKIYNVFVSLVNIEDNTIISSPYEIRLPSIELGKASIADFGILKDIESVQVNLSYNGRNDQKNIYLQKDASANIVDIRSLQFSQEADLGSQAAFNLTLERFSSSDDVYQLVAINLPRQISVDFMDSETNARMSQLRFNQGVNIRNLLLNVYLPDRDDEEVVIDQPIIFHALILAKSEYEKLGDISNKKLAQAEIDKIEGGKVRLEIVPRGVGRIVVRAPSLYHEISTGDSVIMDITVRNDGTRRLDNIKILTESPLNWKTQISPDLIRSLDPEKEESVKIAIVPPEDVSVGAQEVRIRTEAIANNRRVETEDKTVRIQVEAKTPVVMTILLILFLMGIVVGIVIFGIKISKR